MGKAANRGQFCEFVGKALTNIKDDAIEKVDSEVLQKAIDEFGPEGATKSEFIKWIQNGCRMNYILANAFRVGDIFRHRAEKGDRRLWLSDNTQNWIVKPNLERVVPVRIDLGKLSDYRLPKSMNDSAIQIATNNPGCMDLDTFFCVAYLLIFQPKLAKEVLGYELKKDAWYLFHVELADGTKVAMDLDGRGDEWNFCASAFGDDDTWPEGRVLLFFATSAK